jgi:hypothetical protein
MTQQKTPDASPLAALATVVVLVGLCGGACHFIRKYDAERMRERQAKVESFGQAKVVDLFSQDVSKASGRPGMSRKVPAPFVVLESASGERMTLRVYDESPRTGDTWTIRVSDAIGSPFELDQLIERAANN